MGKGFALLSRSALVPDKFPSPTFHVALKRSINQKALSATFIALLRFSAPLSARAAARLAKIQFMTGRTRSELVNCANGPLLQHENFLNIRGVSPEQDTIRHQTMETAKINQSGNFDIRMRDIRI
ncbi:hypothetical protein EVAR_22263_1 [Eumeta japonica]|uniref:Uncharacterized protein n=1 Tax=Eumeta variegata TaxID=151549 RepID=A0A4C1UBT8_EUMVA|nr:hypothetical protein EVAR_22263_1 [Eumeta japonica]